MVQKLVFDSCRVAGVEFDRGGQLQSVRARREVLLCAGAIGSPQILQLSGVGNGDLLQSNGVTVRHHLPEVGENLQDHYTCSSKYRCSQPVTVNDDVASWAGKVKIALRWLKDRGGPMALSAGQVGVFAKSHPDLATPDVQFHFMRYSAQKRGRTLDPFPGFTVTMCQLRPQSRGHVRIRSADCRDKPMIQPNYLAHQADCEVMVAGMRLVREVASQPALASYIDSEMRPGPEVDDDEGLLDYVRANGSTIFHPTSTCRMGSDADAVVTPQLKLNGTEGLRIADASVMPSVVSGNTNAACIMIGEKAADLVLREHG